MPRLSLVCTLALSLGVACTDNPASPGPKSAIASVSLFLDSLTTVPGTQLHDLGIRVLDTLGHVQVLPAVTWTSSDTSVATIDVSGTVQVRATGLVNIIASVGGHADTLPVRVTTFTLTEVSAGTEHACGLTTSHVAVCWGWNGDDDRLGIPDSELMVSGPVAAQGVPPLVSVTVGGGHSCGLTSGGVGYCWGLNENGQLGTGHTNVSQQHLPTAVAGGLTFSSLVAGPSSTCGLTTAGAAYCWGLDEFGQNGHGGDGSPAEDSVPVAVSGGLTFTSITVGQINTCAIAADSTAYCWGMAQNGGVGAFPFPGACGSYLGNTYCAAPVQVGGGHKWVSIGAGTQDACGIASGGAAYCWGLNTSGSTGDTIGRDSLPFAVGGGHVFSSIVATSTHTCAVTTTGQAYCWGTGTGGELGDGGTSNTAVPQAVSGGLTFSSLTAGYFPTCGLTSTNVAYCWGQNGGGSLGVGGFPGFPVMETTPTKVVGQP